MTILTTYQIVTEEELAEAFKGTNFGVTDPYELRKKLHKAVVQKACGYHCGHTITKIMVDLGLIGATGYELPTVKGRNLMKAALHDFLTERI